MKNKGSVPVHLDEKSWRRGGASDNHKFLAHQTTHRSLPSVERMRKLEGTFLGKGA